MKMIVGASNVSAATTAVSFPLLATLLATLVGAALGACSRDMSRKVSSDGQPSDTAIVASGSNPGSDVAAGLGGNPVRGPNNYVGLKYGSLPSNVSYEGGAVLARGAGGVNGDYDFSHVRTPHGNMIWLDTLAAQGSGTPTRIVRAELTIPPLANDERLFMASCDVSGKFDSRVVAIVVSEPNVTQFTKVRQAWRVNVRAARFDLIPVSGVVCEDPGT
jgi:hypothetical protein